MKTRTQQIEELQKVISDNDSLKKEVGDCKSTISELTSLNK